MSDSSPEAAPAAGSSSPSPTNSQETISLGPPGPASQTHGIVSIQTQATGSLSFATSVPVQDLTRDALVMNAPRSEMLGNVFPTLGGIPLLAKLGQGGMGAVYYGFHTRLNKEVAVKILPFHLAEQQPGMIQRFYREAQIAAKVQSPHLVSVSDVNQEQGLFYLVMEYVNGISAAGLLKQSKATGAAGLSEKDALDICIAATEGLAAAHAEGIIHRDIKPDNIMIPKEKDGGAPNLSGAKLADLGLARGESLGQSLTGTQACMGTPGYMSPEQAADAKTCDKPADVFSMGATLYALLSGDAPFHGSALMQVLLDTTQKPHQPIRRIREEVTEPTADLLDCCLSKFPNKRYADGAALLAALKTCRGALDQPAEFQAQARLQVKELRKQGKASDQKIAAAGAPPIRPDARAGTPAKSSKGAVYALLGLLAAALLGGGIFLALNLISGNGTPERTAASPSTGSTTGSAKTSSSDPPPGSKSDSSKPEASKTPSADQTPTQKPPKESELDLGGNVKLKLVLVPPLKESDTPHTYIGKFPVLVGEFRRFVEQAKFVTEAEKEGKGAMLVDQKLEETAGASWKNPGFPQGDNHPVVMVSANDALEFTKWASRLTGKSVRIPNALAWEYAAKGAEERSYPWGDAWDGTRANHADQSLRKSGKVSPRHKCSDDNDGYVFTAPPGTYRNESWCGAVDMSGNVWQWVEHPLGAVTADDRFGHIRGGSWYVPPDSCKVTSHINLPASHRACDIGFRVIVHITNKTAP